MTHTANYVTFFVPYCRPLVVFAEVYQSIPAIVINNSNSTSMATSLFQQDGQFAARYLRGERVWSNAVVESNTEAPNPDCAMEIAPN